jgi:hypothetical protein
MHPPYQIDFRGQWSLDQRRLITEAIVEIETQRLAPAHRAQAKRWICQQHHQPSTCFFAHHVQRSIVLQATSAQALASKIRRWGCRPDTPKAES